MALQSGLVASSLMIKAPFAAQPVRCSAFTNGAIPWKERRKAYNSSSVRVDNLAGKIICPQCEAAGSVLCATCKETGLYVDPVLESQGIIVQVKCLCCGGSGKVLCPTCGGRCYV